MFSFKSSIAARIVFLHIIVVSCTAILMPIFLFWLLSRETASLHKDLMTAQALEIAQCVRRDSGNGISVDLSPALKAQFASQYGRYFFAILDGATKHLIASTNGNPLFATATTPIPNDEQQTSFDGRLISGVTIPENIGGKTILVQVGEDMGHRDVITDDILAGFLWKVGWITGPMLLLLLSIDIVIFRKAIQPLLKASNTARNIGPTRTEIRIPTKDIPNEILPLVNAFNQALDRLDEGFRVQRGFTADAAHELRTPLAILRTRLEQISDDMLRFETQSDVDGMARVIGQLLEIAELDNLLNFRKDSVDLRTLARDVVESLAPLALAANRSLALIECAAPVCIHGNAEMLRRAIRNLVENAIHHAPPNTTVDVEVSEDGAIHVSDAGRGVKPNEYQLVFQRFWRGDQIRSGGAGLGLSIVKQIVESHGGTITVGQSLAGGARFSMQMTHDPRHA